MQGIEHASEAELKAFLAKLDADYAEYASALWHEGIKTPRQLANFTEPHYLACGVRRGHLDDIKAKADTTGEPPGDLKVKLFYRKPGQFFAHIPT